VPDPCQISDSGMEMRYALHLAVRLVGLYARRQMALCCVPLEDRVHWATAWTVGTATGLALAWSLG
jgi:hypothetical protein